MKARKIISLLLSVCMVMSIITPTFADANPTPEQAVLSGEYYEDQFITRSFNNNGQAVNPSTNLNDNFDIEVGGVVETVTKPEGASKNVDENKSSGNPNQYQLRNVENGGYAPSSKSYGIGENNATVNKNYGVIDKNNGTITNNYSSSTDSESKAKVNINYVNGTVGQNGNKENSDLYRGFIETNYGTITTNTEAGEVKTNGDKGKITTNNGTVECNSAGGTVTTNNGTIVKNDFNGKVITNSTNGTVTDNYGVVDNNGGKLVNNLGIVDNNTSGTIKDNAKIIHINNGTVTTNKYNFPLIIGRLYYGFIYTNNNEIEKNDGYVWENSGNIKSNSTNYGVVYNNSGKITNDGVIVNNNKNDSTGTEVNNKRTIVNNFGTVTEFYATAAPTNTPVGTETPAPTATPTVNNVGTIENNYGTVKFDGTKGSDSGSVYKNYGTLINAELKNGIYVEKVKTDENDADITLHGVTIANNKYDNNSYMYDNVLFNKTVEKSQTVQDINLSDYIYTKDGYTLSKWVNAFDGQEFTGDLSTTNIDKNYWLYAKYNISSTAAPVYNKYQVEKNEGKISYNMQAGVIENNEGKVGVNYGTVKFDKKADQKDGDVVKAYVETNYGVLENAKQVSLDNQNKVIASDDTTTPVSKTVYVDAGEATAKLIAITYSRNGILDEDFWNAVHADKRSNDSLNYTEFVAANEIWETNTKTENDFKDSTTGTYKILDGINGKNTKNENLGLIIKENYSNPQFLYWVDVLDNNKIYNYGEISELTSITKAMWLRPVYSADYVIPGGGGGGSTGGSDITGGNESPAIISDIPTNTPMTAGDILNDPNMTPETKELLNEILDKNSTGSIIIKEDGTIAVPGPGGIPVDVTIEDDKVTLGTMTKDDIKKAVDSLKNSDSGKTDDKTDDKRDGKTDTKVNSNPKTNKAISIDVSVFKGIGQVEVNNDTLNNIAESEAEGLKTTMSIGSITLDKPAISGVSGILMGRNLILVVEEMDEGLLSKKQKKLVEESKEDENYLAVVDSYLLAANDKIKNLGNGKAILEIKLDALGYKEAAGKAPVVYEIAEDGTKTKIDYEIVDHIITFEVNELSTYLITVE